MDQAGKSMPFLKSVSASKQEFDQALHRLGGVKDMPSVVSVKRKRKMDEAQGEEEVANTKQSSKRQRKV